jgi:hypothetical protein
VSSGSSVLVRTERLGDELRIHVLADLVDEATCESEDPTVVVVVPATAGQLVTSGVLHYDELAVGVDAMHFHL